VRGRKPNALRIAHVIDQLSVGGAQLVLLANLEALDPAQFESAVYYLHPFHDLAERVHQLGISTVCLNARNSRDFPRATLQLWTAFRKWRPDVVHTQVFGADVCGRLAGRLAGVPAIVSSFTGAVFERRNNARLGYLQNLMQRATYRLSGAQIIALTDSVARDVQRDLGAPDPVVIPQLPFDRNQWRPITLPERAQARARLEIGADSFVFGCLARLQPLKGVEFLLRAIARLHPSLPSVNGIVIGEGPDRERLMRLRAELRIGDIVQFTGWLPDPRSALAACDAVAIPSLSEGLPLVMLQSMSAGLPCIASRVGGIPELAADGVNALLVQPADPAQLADAIRRLATDATLRQRLRTGGAELVGRLPSTAQNARRLEALYKHPVAKQRARAARGQSARSAGS